LANRAGGGGSIPNSLWAIIFIVFLACGFGVVNGFNDAANCVATPICTRALSPRKAILLATVFNFIGSASGLAVARTIGKGILAPEAISYEVAVAALLSIIIWGIAATYWGLPISLHHGFISGLGRCRAGPAWSRGNSLGRYAARAGGGCHRSASRFYRRFCHHGRLLLDFPQLQSE
jgi:PiT family inorganic phosphate transporter